DRLISDISHASRLDAELSRAETSVVDLRKMLETLAEVSEMSSIASDVRVRMQAANGRALLVPGLEDRLVQVFRNLIANAVSFSPPGGVITIKAKREKGKIVAEILDEGQGIPEGKEATIFDRFYSERPEGEKYGTHSGLGLSISKQIIDAHKGEIFAENLRDRDGRVRGARFVVRLPAQKG
ncbi:MAG: histidine kinase, partial [Rhodospirillales bacterium]|nr:histidine kinase [Rhodospirillales bacterium]